MKGKSYSIPVGMVFNKYYCHKCGAKLEKERTHRVVTKGDKDYFNYQDINMYPYIDHDVYDYRFKCPSCKTRISFKEQRVIQRIQKICNSKTLSSIEVNNNFKICKTKEYKKSFIKSILIPIILTSIFFVLFYFFGANRKDFSLYVLIVLYILTISISVISTIRRYKGKYSLRVLPSYTYEEEARLNQLHNYCTQNISLIIVSRKCCCFHCKSKFDSTEIVEYIDNGQTALCPKCQIGAILPEKIILPDGEVEINERTIYDMNKYWF